MEKRSSETGQSEMIAVASSYLRNLLVYNKLFCNLETKHYTPKSPRALVDDIEFYAAFVQRHCL